MYLAPRSATKPPCTQGERSVVERFALLAGGAKRTTLAREYDCVPFTKTARLPARPVHALLGA